MSTWYFPVIDAKEYNRGSYMDKHTKGNRTHYAIDIYAKRGSTIVAPTGGRVIGSSATSGEGDLGGHYIRILGNDGYTYYFAHMDNASKYEKGDTVQAGAFIGAVGSTGSAKGTTPHLHFSMRNAGGNPVNPYSWLSSNQNNISDGSGGLPPGGLTAEERESKYAYDATTQATAFPDVEEPGAGGVTFEFEEDLTNTDPAYLNQLAEFRNDLRVSQGQDPVKRSAADQMHRSLMYMASMVRAQGFDTGIADEIQQVGRDEER